MTSQGLMPARNAVLNFLIVIAQENFDSGHFELFNFSGRHYPGDLGTWKRPGTSCKIEIHF